MYDRINPNFDAMCFFLVVDGVGKANMGYHYELKLNNREV